MFYARNLDTTNVLYFSWNTNGLTITNMCLKPGEPMMMRLYQKATIGNLHAKGSTAGDFEATILEE